MYTLDEEKEKVYNEAVRAFANELFEKVNVAKHRERLMAIEGTDHEHGLSFLGMVLDWIGMVEDGEDMPYDAPAWL
jgi:hypothetical protein